MSDHIHEQFELLHAAVGTEKTSRLGRLANRDFARFATAAGMESALSSEKPAVAPHLYLSSVMGWGSGPSETDLAPDGTGASETRGFPLTGLRLMGAGQDLEFHAPVRDGMVVTETARLDDVQLKQGRSGEFLVVQLVRGFRDEAGTALVTCRESFIGR